MAKNEIVKYLLIFVLMIGGCSADYHSKRWAEHNLKGKQPTTVIGGLLEFGFVENRGMIFGILNKTMPEAGKKILVCFRIVILIALTIFMWRYRSRRLLFHVPFILIWSGAVGNLIDLSVYGYVVDFIHLKLDRHLDWPFYFNLADAYVTVGIAILLVFNRYIKTEITSMQ
jgi:signal peptidase II